MLLFLPNQPNGRPSLSISRFRNPVDRLKGPKVRSRRRGTSSFLLGCDLRERAEGEGRRERRTSTPPRRRPPGRGTETRSNNLAQQPRPRSKRTNEKKKRNRLQVLSVARLCARRRERGVQSLCELARNLHPVCQSVSVRSVALRAHRGLDSLECDCRSFVRRRRNALSQRSQTAT